jgi:hypothetical protein
VAFSVVLSWALTITRPANRMLKVKMSLFILLDLRDLTPVYKQGLKQPFH